MHKKYVRKRGRKFGPYFYTTIRGKDGIARSYYLSQDYEEALRKEQELKDRFLKEKEGGPRAIPQFAYAAVVIAFACAFLFLGGGFTGMFVSGDAVQYTQELGMGFTQSSSRTITLQAHPDQFYLSSLSLSGKAMGTGNAKVYIESPSGERYLVFIHSPPAEGIDLTGMVTASGNETINITEEANLTAIEEPINETNATLPEEASLTEPINGTNVTLPEPEPEINLTIPENVTGPDNTTAPEANATGNVTAPDENATIPEEHANITLPDETANITAPEPFPEPNMTEPANMTNITAAEMPEPQEEAPAAPPAEYIFSSACADTCLFTEDDGFTEDSYLIIIELDEGTELVLDRIGYSAIDTSPPEGRIDVEFKRTMNDPSFDIIIESAELEDGELLIRFHHNSLLYELPIGIDGELDYDLTHDVAGMDETVTLIVHGWDNEPFSLLVGEHPGETIVFGSRRNIEFRGKIRDASGRGVAARADFIDPDTKDIVKTVTFQESDEYALPETFEIAEGTYDIDLVPERHTIKKVGLKHADIDSSLTGLINIDEVPPTGGFVRMYAIDPTPLNFSSADVTVEASGTSLYKCTEWDFGSQSCNGEWAFLRAITPGENYTFTLTPEDPGFGEYGESEDESSTTSTAFQTKLSKTFEIQEAGYYVVLLTAQLRVDSSSYSVLSRWGVSSESGPSAVELTTMWEPMDTTDYQTYVRHSSVYFNAGNHSVFLQWASENSKATAYIKNARISVFNASDYNYTAFGGQQELADTWGDMLTLSFTPAASDDYLILASGEYGGGSNRYTVYADLQVDGTSIDEALYNPVDTSDYKPFMFHNVTYLDTSSHTIKIRGMEEAAQANGIIRKLAISAIRMTEDFDYHSTESNTESSTTSDSYQDKATLTFTPEEEGDYLLIATAEIGESTDTDSVYGLFEIDGSTYCEHIQMPMEASSPRDYFTFACSKNLTLGTVSHTAKIRYKSSSTSATAYIRNARITAIRISPLPANQAPQITLLQPGNCTQTNDTGDVTFTFTAADDQNAAFSCSLYLDGNLNQTNGSVQNATSSGFFVAGISPGSHSWHINCTDGDISGVSETRYLDVVITPPSVTNVGPAGGGEYNLSQTVSIRADASDASGLSWVKASILHPNGTTRELYMSNTAGSAYEYNFTEIYQKGIYNITIVARDAFGNMNATEGTWFERTAQTDNIEVIDESNGMINYTQTVTSNNSGILDIEIALEGGDQAIQSLMIYNFSESSELNVLRAAPLDSNSTIFSGGISIDPTNLNYDLITVTITAKSNYLYKCTDWNFTEQDCYGDWAKMISLTPGQNYTFNLTAGDPGYGEINITEAEHLDTDYTYISTIYDEVKALDGIWSEPIYENQFVRATYESNLTNGSVIDVFLRNNNSADIRFDIYHAGTTSPVLGSSGNVSNPAGQWAFIALKNVSVPSDVFDFRIIDTSPGNNYVEFDYIHDALAFGRFFDDFEFDNFSTTWTQGAQLDWDRDNERSYGGGSWAAHLDGSTVDGILERAAIYDLARYDYCDLSARVYLESSFDAGEYVCMDISTNGGTTWNMNTGSPNQAGFQDLCVDGNVDLENTWNYVYFNITGANLTSQFKFRFRGKTNSPVEDAHVDHVNLTCYFTDRKAPYWSYNGTNASYSTRYGQSVYFNVTLYDDWQPGYRIFSLYNGTQWLNSSASLWTNATEIKETRTITARRGMTVQWYWWFSDTTNNTNQTDTWSFVVNNTEPTHDYPILNATTSGNASNNDLYCWNRSTYDVDWDMVTNVYRWYKDGALQPSLENNTVVTEWNTTEGEYWICEVTPYDAYGGVGVSLNSTAVLIRSAVDPVPPTSNHPYDQTVEMGSETSIVWVLQDNYVPGEYYVTRNGTLYSGPYAWTNNTPMIIQLNNYFLGTWSYTIYYNDSVGNMGTPDTVLVNVVDNVKPSCNETACNGPTLASITIDGDMSDWDAALSDTDNYITDLTTGGGDLDTVGTADRDLSQFGFTWDSQYLYLYYKRLYTGNTIVRAIAYIDYDRDGYMNSTDKVVFFTWFGSAQNYNSDLYNYIPSGPGGDLMNGSGYDMPGSITINRSLESTVPGGAPNGIELETRTLWSDLGFSGPNAVIIQPASSLGSNLPSQLEDNVDTISNAYSCLLFRPDRSMPAKNGTSVYFDHELMNCGIIKETIDLTNQSSNGWNVTLYYPNGTVITDTDSDSIPDVGLVVQDYTPVIVRIDVPPTAYLGTTETTTVTATPSVDSAESKTVTDIITTGDISITPGTRTIYGARGMTATINYTVYNYQGFNDTIEINATSSQGWNMVLYYQNGSPITDTDSDGHPDLGNMLPSESVPISLRMVIPPGATNGTQDITTIRINSSFNPSLTTTATASTTVRNRLILYRDYNRSVGIGSSTYYYITVTNNWNESDVIDLTYTYLLNWSTMFYAADMITLLTDTDSDQKVDVGPLAPYGGEYGFYVRVIIPPGAEEFQSELTTVYANSSLNTSLYDKSVINTTARRVITYLDSGRTYESENFEVGSTVYSRAHNLQSVNNIYFEWLDPIGMVWRTSQDIPVSAYYDADDQFYTNISHILGNWTVVVFNAQGDTEIGRIVFYVRDTTPPYWLYNKTNASATTKTGQSVYFNVTPYDNYAPNETVFHFYNGTEWINGSAMAWTNKTELSEYRTITATRGMYVRWYWRFNDTSGNLAQTPIWSFRVDNTPPTNVSLSSPVNDYNTTDITPSFSWTPSYDADGDPINYTLKITCNGGCSDDNREYNTSSSSFTVPSDLQYYGDDGYYYNWSVRAWDGYNYSGPSGTRNFTVYTAVIITLVNDTVNFGTKLTGEADNTTDNSPWPLVLRNDGNAFIDVKLSASDMMWDTQSSASRYFQFKADSVTGEEGSFNTTASITSWTNISTSDLRAIRQLNYTNSTDEAEIDILIEVPIEELPGNKSAILMLIGEYV